MRGLQKLEYHEDIGKSEGAGHGSGNRNNMGRVWASESQVDHRDEPEAGRQVDQMCPSPQQ